MSDYELDFYSSSFFFFLFFFSRGDSGQVQIGPELKSNSKVGCHVNCTWEERLGCCVWFHVGRNIKETKIDLCLALNEREERGGSGDLRRRWSWTLAVWLVDDVADGIVGR